jgi:tRNA uridine 5-carbamoylmethylation protein Kti12
MKPELVILIGNIGSGKSTLCRKYAKKGYIIISRDALRYMIGAGDYIFDYKYEPAIHAANLAILESFLAGGHNIVMDEVNVSKSLREAYIQLARSVSQIRPYKIIGVVLPRLSRAVSVDRRINSPHGNFPRETWEKVWDTFNKMYVTPTKAEGFDRIIKIEGGAK